METDRSQGEKDNWFHIYYLHAMVDNRLIHHSACMSQPLLREYLVTLLAASSVSLPDNSSQ